MQKKTEEEVKKAYGLARTMGRMFAETHQKMVHHLDADDYTQEAIIAWMEGKHIPYKLVDLYRKESPIGRREWIKKKGRVTSVDPVNVDDIENLLPSEVDVEADAEKQIRLKAIQKVVDDMIDPRQQIIMILHYVYDKSLTEIGQGLGLSKSYTSKLHGEALTHIRKEIEKNGDN